MTCRVVMSIETKRSEDMPGVELHIRDVMEGEHSDGVAESTYVMSKAFARRLRDQLDRLLSERRHGV